MSAADAPPAPTRADTIVVAITQGIVAAQTGQRRKLVHCLGGRNGHA